MGEDTPRYGEPGYVPPEDRDPIVVPEELFDKQVAAAESVGVPIYRCARLEVEGLVTYWHPGLKRFWVRGDPKLARTVRAWSLERGLHLEVEG